LGIIWINKKFAILCFTYSLIYYITKYMKDIILSGLRPTGRLHIGNYLGSLKNFLKLQDQYECYFFIADLHSLNEPFDPKTKYSQIMDLAADYIALGIDPKKCVIFAQSHVHEHSEFAVILSNIIPVPYLFRMTQYKDKSEDKTRESVNAGLLYYPVLMASDILMYKSTLVPVGQDQTQHVELARDVALMFNKNFGETFPLPKSLYTESSKIMSLLLPDKKMSKSLGDAHCIYIDDDPKDIEKKLARAVTDTGSGKSSGAKNLLDLVKIFGKPDVYNTFLSDKSLGIVKYSEVKKVLSRYIAEYFADFRKKKKKLMENPKHLEDILERGAKIARLIAQNTMEEVKKKVGLTR